MCAKCKDPKGKCKIRYIALMHIGRLRSSDVKPVGSKKGIENLREALIGFINSSKDLAQYQIDTSQINSLQENEGDPQKYDNNLKGELNSWVWFTIHEDPNFSVKQ